MASTIPTTPANFDRTRLIERPDGFYWQRIEDDREYGPFRTLQEAVDDMEYSESAMDDDDSDDESGSEIGIADWLDAEAGEFGDDAMLRIDDR